MKKLKRLGLVMVLTLIFALSLTTLTACPTNEDTVKSITVSKMPTKTEYILGATLEVTGGEITVVMSDDTETTLSLSADGVKCSPSILNTVGEDIKITVTYKDKSTQFAVKVSPVVESISITTQPSKLDGYLTGDQLQLTDGKVLITYLNSHPSKTVDMTDNMFSVTPMVLNTAGNNITITVALKADPGKKDTFTVSVTQRPISEIKINKWPTTPFFIVGGELKLDGGEVTLTYPGGSTADVEISDPRFTLKAYDFADNGDKIGNQITDLKNLSSAGFKTIRICYTDTQYVEIPAFVFDLLGFGDFLTEAYRQVEPLATLARVDASILLYCYNYAMNIFKPYISSEVYEAALTNFPGCEYDFEAILYYHIYQHGYERYNNAPIGNMLDTIENFIYGTYNYGLFYPEAKRWGLINARTLSEDLSAFIDYYIECFTTYIDNYDLDQSGDLIDGIDVEKLLTDYLALNTQDKYDFLTIIAGKDYEYGETVALYSSSTTPSFFADMLWRYCTDIQAQYGGDDFLGAYYWLACASEFQAIQNKLYNDIALLPSYRASAWSNLQYYYLNGYVFLGYFLESYNTLEQSGKDEIERLFPGLYDSIESDIMLYDLYAAFNNTEYYYASDSYDPISYIVVYEGLDQYISTLSDEEEALLSKTYYGLYTQIKGATTFTDWQNAFNARYNTIMAKKPASAEGQAFVRNVIDLAIELWSEDGLVATEANVGALLTDFLELTDADRVQVFKFFDSYYGDDINIQFFEYYEGYTVTLYNLFTEYFNAVFAEVELTVDYESFLRSAMHAIEHSSAYAVNANEGNRFTALNYVDTALTKYDELLDDAIVGTTFAAIVNRLNSIKNNLDIAEPVDETITSISSAGMDSTVYLLGEELATGNIYVQVTYSNAVTVVVKLSDDRFEVTGFNKANVGKQTLTVKLTADQAKTFTFDVYVIDYKGLVDLVDEVGTNYRFYHSNGILADMYDQYLKAPTGTEIKPSAKHYNDTTTYIISFRALEAKINDYLNLDIDASFKTDVEKLIKTSNHAMSLYDVYMYYKSINGPMDEVLNNNSDLKTFYEYYIESAKVYLAKGNYTSRATKLWNDFLSLSLEEQYYFMGMLDGSGFENYMFAYKPYEYSDGSVRLYDHFYSVLFNGDDNNIFSSILFDYFYKGLPATEGTNFAKMANWVVLMVDLRATYNYWAENLSDNSYFGLITYQVNWYYSIYFQNIENDEFGIGETTKFKELFGNMNDEGSLIYELVQFYWASFFATE